MQRQPIPVPADAPDPPAAAPRARRAPVEEYREYHRSRMIALQKQLPTMLARICSDDAPPDLTPLEVAAREFRQSLIRDLGGPDRCTSDRLALVQVVVGSWLVLSAVDVYLLGLAAREGLVNKKHRRVFPVVESRSRLAESFARQLGQLGIERHARYDDAIELERLLARQASRS
jgi:hypothetical protein